MYFKWWVCVGVILSDGRRKHTEPSLFRSVPMPVSDLDLLLICSIFPLGSFMEGLSFCRPPPLMLLHVLVVRKEDLVVRCLKNLFQSAVKGTRCLFILHLYSSCSAGLLMTEILDLYIAIQKTSKISCYLGQAEFLNLTNAKNQGSLNAN